jgi:ABC-type phosphate/phosphonate transport system substrate-binding protein
MKYISLLAVVLLFAACSSDSDSAKASSTNAAKVVGLEAAGLTPQSRKLSLAPTEDSLTKELLPPNAN